jgi:hypothetical protein
MQFKTNILVLVFLGNTVIWSWRWMISILNNEGYQTGRTLYGRNYLVLSIPSMISLIKVQKNKTVKVKYLLILLTSILSCIGLVVEITFLFLAK